MTSIFKKVGRLLDAETNNGGSMAIRSGRSWWAARYRDLDTWVHEWDPDPGSPNRHLDWPRMRIKGRQAVRLYCPNGKMAELGDSVDAQGKLFQFKLGQRHIRFGATMADAAIESKEHLSQVIGMIDGTNGECLLYAWEIVPAPMVPLDAPKPPDEREWIAKSAEPGLYEQAVARWNEDFGAYQQSESFRHFERSYKAWQLNAGGRLIGPIYDNVYAMKYQGVGRLNADHLGIPDGEGR